MRVFILIALLFPLTLMAQEKQAYRIFDAKGKAVTYQEVIKKAQKADVFFFGEQHNNPIAHWLQLEMTQDLFTVKDSALILGAEMFESDNQLLIDEYFADMISQKNFEDEARLWNNYKTDYKPLLEFAKAHSIPFIATNIPRRYASLVFRNGLEQLDALPAAAKNYLAPLPIEVDLNLSGYKKMMEMMGGHGGGNTNFPKSQAIKDATMAHFIAQHLQKKHLFIHYNGAYHSDDFQGILWYLQRYAPKAKTLTITTVEQNTLDELSADFLNKADFIICTPATMTKTY